MLYETIHLNTSHAAALTYITGANEKLLVTCVVTDDLNEDHIALSTRVASCHKRSWKNLVTETMFVTKDVTPIEAARFIAKLRLPNPESLMII